MSEKRQDSLSVAQQVDHLEDKLLHCREALEDIDFKLRREDLTLKRRESLEKQKSLLAMQAEAYACNRYERSGKYEAVRGQLTLI
uniref:Coiled-coil domain-containing protein 167 n=1 Tax=Pogona vitticeps TaxID=103695 RepID=A0ABM5FQQ8_9SAUR